MAPGLPMASVPTGMPAGICRSGRSESLPSSAWVFIGTPKTGSGVSDAVMPAVCCSTRTRDHNLEALFACRLGELEQSLWRAVSGDDEGPMANAERVQRVGGMFHGCPIGLASHDDRNWLRRHFDLRQAQNEALDYRHGYRAGKRSRDDVGREFVFDIGNTVAQVELTLFKRCTWMMSEPGKSCNALIAVSRSRCSCCRRASWGEAAFLPLTSSWLLHRGVHRPS